MTELDDVPLHDAGATAAAAARADELVRRVLFTVEGRADPYPIYAELRAIAPVHRSALGGNWLVTRYEDCEAVLRDPRLGKGPANFNDLISPPGADHRPMPVAMRDGALVFMNPPDHTRLRGLVGKAFTPRRVERLRERTRALTDHLLDELVDGGDREVDLDLMEGFAFEVPVQVIADLVGVPLEDRAQFRQWVRSGAVGLEPGADDEAWARAQAAAEELARYFHALIRRRRREPTGDLLSALIAARDGADKISKSELIVTSILLFGAGFETTMNLIGNAVLTLVDHPDQLARLRSDRSLVPSAVEEVLRYQSTAQLAGRLVLEPAEIGGAVGEPVRVEPGSWVIAFLGSANRDGTVFPDPDSFVVSRRPNRHLSFSVGPHHCLGASLARMELAVVLECLLDRFSRIELIGPRPTWRPGLVVRGPESLPVRLVGRGGRSEGKSAR